MQENSIQNTGAKYSEMLMQLVNEFDELLPIELTFEDTLEIGIDAWNLANDKEFLMQKKLYKLELTKRKNHSIIDKMVTYKIENFQNFNNIIVDYSTTDNILQVKTQTREDHLKSLINKVIKVEIK